MFEELLSTHLACRAPGPAHCAAGSLLSHMQGGAVEQAAAVKVSLKFMPGAVAHDPPGSTDDICLFVSVNSQT